MSEHEKLRLRLEIIKIALGHCLDFSRIDTNVLERLYDFAAFYEGKGVAKIRMTGAAK